MTAQSDAYEQEQQGFKPDFHPLIGIIENMESFSKEERWTLECAIDELRTAMYR